MYALHFYRYIQDVNVLRLDARLLLCARKLGQEDSFPRPVFAAKQYR
jgi:hypothetical protein